VMMVTIAMVIVMGREERARKERQGAGIDFFIPCPPTNRPHLRWPYLTHDIWFGHIADRQTHRETRTVRQTGWLGHL
jgi:hypothetical protein